MKTACQLLHLLGLDTLTVVYADYISLVINTDVDCINCMFNTISVIMLCGLLREGEQLPIIIFFHGLNTP